VTTCSECDRDLPPGARSHALTCGQRCRKARARRIAGARPPIGDLVRALRTANPHWPIGYLALKVGLTEQEVRAILRGGLSEARANTNRVG
jgi:hypothetical protein